jgi:hypothetical protein
MIVFGLLIQAMSSYKVFDFHKRAAASTDDASATKQTQMTI